MIPFFSLEGRRRETEADVIRTISEVWTSDTFIGGDYVDKFESDYADFVNVPHCVGVGNGLDALRLILAGLDIGPGDEVIVPSHTFIATWLAVTQVGATPIAVDVEMESGNLDSSQVEAALTSKTAAIIVVHLYGKLGPVRELLSLCQRHGLFLIEDAAQAHGATLDGVHAGAFGEAAAFSFYPTKNLGAVGDAGCVTTRNSDLALRIRSLRSYGSSTISKYEHLEMGWNSRLDPLQAAVLSVFLLHLPEWNRRRAETARSYLKAFEDHNFQGALQPLHTDPDGSANVWHHFVVRAQDRHEFRSFLDIAGVGTDIHYPVPAYRAVGNWAPSGSVSSDCATMSVAESLARSVVSLPMHPWLGSQAVKVTEALERYTKSI